MTTAATTERERVTTVLARLERVLLAAAGERMLALEVAEHDEHPLERLARHATRGWSRLVIGRGRVVLELHQALELRQGSLVVSPVTEHELRAAPLQHQLAVLDRVADLLTQLAQRTTHDVHEVCDVAEDVLASFEAEAEDGDSE